MKKTILFFSFLISTAFTSFGQNQYELTFNSIDQIQVKQIISKLMPVFSSYPTVSEDFLVFKYNCEAVATKKDVEQLLNEMKVELKSFKKEENE